MTTTPVLHHTESPHPARSMEELADFVAESMGELQSHQRVRVLVTIKALADRWNAQPLSDTASELAFMLQGDPDGYKDCA